MMHLFAQKRRDYIAKSNIPEQPIIKSNDMPMGTKFTFVDFVPSYKGTDTDTGKPTYHSFGDLITIANRWLRTVYDWELVNCETGITSYLRDSDLYCVSIWERQTRDAYHQGVKDVNGPYVESALSVLRLWMQKRVNPMLKIVNLSYIDFEPVRLSDGSFENLDHVVARLNNEITSADGSSGRIINIETVNISSETRDLTECDPELTVCCNLNEIQGILQFVRVYLDDDEISKRMTIGFKDFIPEHLSGGVFLKPEYESFSNISDRAMLWLSQDPELIFISAETKEAPMKSRASLDTRRMRHYLAKSGLDYIRFIRIWFGKSLVDESPSTNDRRVSFVTSKIVSTKHTDNRPMCVTIEQTKLTVARWFDSIESKLEIKGGKFIELFPKSKFDVKDEIENCYQAHNMFINRTKYLAAQIYFDVGPTIGVEKVETIKYALVNKQTKAVKSMYCTIS